MVNRKQAELEFIYKTALNTDPDVIESLFLEVIFPHGKKKTLVSVARTDHQVKTLLCLLTNSTIFSH